MPTNNWKDQLFMTDLNDALVRGDGFEPVRNQIVHRIRTAPFYRHDDIVLRNLVEDLATAVSLDQANREWDLFTLWADQGQRLWIETSLSLDAFNAAMDKRLALPFEPPPETVTTLVRRLDLPGALYQPILIDALAEWCELTDTDPYDVGDDEDARAALAVLEDDGLLEFYQRRAQSTGSAFTGNLERAALVLLGGAHLAQLCGTPVAQATRRVAQAVTDQLGTPTGYEWQPDLLAREIHNGAEWAAM
jgi:hypothetical protein